MRRLAPLLALLLVAAIAGGCGGDSDDEGALDDARALYLPARAELVAVGQDIGIAINGADQRSDAQLATSFGELRDRTAAAGERIGALELPGDLIDERDALGDAVAVAAADLGRISDAAAAHDGPAARTATQDLVAHSETVRNARDALDGLLGVEEEDEGQTAPTAPETAPTAPETSTAPPATVTAAAPAE